MTVELVPVVGKGEPCHPGEPMLPCMLGEARIPPGEGPDVPREGAEDPPGLPAVPAPAPAARFGHEEA